MQKAIENAFFMCEDKLFTRLTQITLQIEKYALLMDLIGRNVLYLNANRSHMPAQLIVCALL